MKLFFQSLFIRFQSVPKAAAGGYGGPPLQWVLIVLCLVPASADWKKASEGYAWSFPRDHWAHPSYKNEWWYLTGQFETDETPPRRFGYQFTLFRIGLSTAPAGAGSAWQSGQALMGHAVLTDIGAQTHFFTDTLTRETPFLGRFADSLSLAQPIAWMIGPTGNAERWTVRWENDGFHITATTPDFAFDLHTHALKPLIFEGPGGLSRKTGDGRAASLYYSFTRLNTTGRLTYQGRSQSVHGLSWMDKEFGSNTLGPDQVGWDWFSLQFQDGHELMLYLMRRQDGSIAHAQGTLVDAKGHAHYLKDTDFQVRTIAHWKNPQGAAYPNRWVITLTSSPAIVREGSTFTVVPEVFDQENRGQRITSIHYWEGAVLIQDASNHLLGQGYVELTGYAQPVQSAPIAQ